MELSYPNQISLVSIDDTNIGERLKSPFKSIYLLPVYLGQNIFGVSRLIQPAQENLENSDQQKNPEQQIPSWKQEQIPSVKQEQGQEQQKQEKRANA